MIMRQSHFILYSTTYLYSALICGWPLKKKEISLSELLYVASHFFPSHVALLNSKRTSSTKTPSAEKIQERNWLLLFHVFIKSWNQIYRFEKIWVKLNIFKPFGWGLLHSLYISVENIWKRIIKLLVNSQRFLKM